VTTLEIALAVGGAVIAVLLFGLEVHGRRMDQRSPRERLLLAVIMLFATLALTAFIIHSRQTTPDVPMQPSQSTGGTDTVQAAPGIVQSSAVTTNPPAQSSIPRRDPLSAANDDITRTSNSSWPSPERTSPPPATSAVESPPPAQDTPRSPACVTADTGSYGFVNTDPRTPFAVTLYYREGSDEGRRLTLLPGQTGHVYDFPVGGHPYLITYRAQVPIMSFPPGAPTMPQDVIHSRGEIYVEQCKSGSLEIPSLSTTGQDRSSPPDRAGDYRETPSEPSARARVAPSSAARTVIGVVTSIDLPTRTVKLTTDNGDTEAVTVPDGTVVSYRGERYRLQNLERGDRVRITFSGVYATRAQIDVLENVNAR
jgi:hypothetical protein